MAYHIVPSDAIPFHAIPYHAIPYHCVFVILRGFTIIATAAGPRGPKRGNPAMRDPHGLAHC